MTSKQKEVTGMKKVLLYVLIPVCLVFVVIKWVIPTVDGGADPPSVKQKSVAVLRKWDEGQLKQFDREDRVGTTYTLGGLEVETLKVEPRVPSEPLPYCAYQFQKKSWCKSEPDQNGFWL